MSDGLIFRAGPAAYEAIRRNGFDASMIGTFAGASGGAKWLVLSQLDRVVASELLPRLSSPVHTIGTSIGAWRFACYLQSDPLAALERFERAYIEQTYSEKPDRQEITETSVKILDDVIPDSELEYMLSHPRLRMHIMAVRSRHVLASENTPMLVAGLAASAGMNALSRRTLGAFFERALFHDPRDTPPFRGLTGFPLQEIVLSRDNLKAAVLATGSIPLVLEGVAGISGARPGVYRDGGVIDYHLDLPHSEPGRIALFLHFYDWITPGWFDKKLRWRRPRPAHVSNTLLISPSPDFVASLPYAKIPDRHDFTRYPEDERIGVWRTVVDRCRELADELRDVLASGRLGDRLVRWDE
jgi:hypothetical protein